MSTENDKRPNNPTFRVIDMAAEARKAWGPEWNAPEVSYEFTGRKFKLRTEDASIYQTSPDF